MSAIWHFLGKSYPVGKQIWIPLTNIYGVGQHRARATCARLGVNPTSRIRDIPDHVRDALYLDIRHNYQIDSDLKRQVGRTITRLVDMGSYRGLRHQLGLPVRGQRSKTNAKTQKKLAGRRPHFLVANYDLKFITGRVKKTIFGGKTK